MVLVLLFFGLFSYTRAGAPEQVFAATSSNLNFQGRLLTDSGNVVPDGYYNLEFKLFNAGSSSGSSQGSCAGDANCLWTETRDFPGADNRVRTVNGYFSVNLGSVTALPDINWDQDLWLTMNVGGNTTSPSWDGEMSPRIKLTAVPFAQAAKNVYSSDTDSASTDSDDVSIQTGNAAGTTSNSGDITIDVGTATGTAGTISVGVANTSGITIGYVGVLTDIGGDLTVSGSQFTNEGSTLNTAQSLGDFPTGGAIGTAAATVDVTTTFNIAQTTASQTLSLPDPTDTTAGRTVYVVNTGTTGFNMHSVTILNGYGQVFIWNGSSWVLAASGGSSGTVSLQGAYDGGNILTTSNARDIDITLADTATDSNFIIDIASGSTGEFIIQSDNTDVLQIGAAGQLQLDVQGNSGGILIGEDALLYRSAADTLTAGSLNATTGINTGSDSGTQRIDSSGNLVNIGDLTTLGPSTFSTTGANGFTFQPGSDNSTAFRIQDSGASNTLFNANTTDNHITIGDGDDTSSTNTTLFIVDSASSTNAPAGVNGGMYYDTTLNRFRCFQAGSWTDCVTNIGTTVTDLQSAYDGGNTIATTDGNDIDVTLSNTTTDANFIINVEAGSSSEFKIQNDGSDVIRIGGAGHLFAGGAATATTATTSGTGTDTTTLTFTGTTSFANNDVIFIDNSSGQDYYTRIESGGSAASVTVNPAVTFESGVTVTKHNVQNIGSNINGPPSSSGSQFFQGYFSGGIVAGSTTYSDGNIQSAGITLQDSSDSTTAFLIQNSSGTNLFQVDAANNRVYIGNSTPDSVGTILVLDSKNTPGDPTGVNGSLYYNSSANRFRCHENGSWGDCGTLPQTGYFDDDTGITLSDSNTNLWQASPYPNLEIENSSNTIIVSVVLYGSAAGNDDEYNVFTLRRAAGSNPTCSSTQVGIPFTLSSNRTNAPLGTSATFVDIPGTTGDMRYTVCSSTDSLSSNSSVNNNIDVITFTLQESGS